MKSRIYLIVMISLLFTGISFAQTQAPPPNAQTESPPLKEKDQTKISLDIKGMDIIDVLKMLSTRAGLNIVVGKNVTGKVTLFLKDVNIWDAFEIVLLANDLAYERKGDIINILTQRDYELRFGERFQDNKQVKVVQLKYAKAVDLSRALNQIKTNLGRVVIDEGSNTVVMVDTPEKIQEMVDFIKLTDLPLQTQIFGLNYAQADKLQPKIQEVLTKGVGSLRIDERTNKIAVTDYPQKIEEISNLLSAFDEKTPQVLIDAQIIELTPQDKLEMGVDWNFWMEKHFQAKAPLPINTSNALILGTIATTTPDEKGEYKSIIDLLRTIGDTKILSSPRIMALNNQESKILVGKKDAYITSTTSQTGSSSVTSQSVNFVDTGIKLFVTPTINRDNFVTMKIKPEISSAQSKPIKSADQTTDVPIVTTSEAETTVTVKDGVTIIIAGLRRDQREKTVKKIPLLGDIPGLGFLFRSTSDDLTKTELIILLTPHIMSGESSYTDFSEIKPVDGAVVKMEKGRLVTEKFKGGEPKVEPTNASLAKVESLPSQPRNESLKKAPVEKEGPIGAPVKVVAAKHPSKREGLVPVPERDLSELDNFEYYRLVLGKVKGLANSSYPRGEKGEIKLAFTVSRDGNLVDGPYVLETTNDLLNSFGIKAVKGSSPFPSFPKSIEKEKETFKISLSYK